MSPHCEDVAFPFRRLAKSTLLLIPLFGIHHVVFVTLGESMAEDYKIFFDLALGSFQVCFQLLPLRAHGGSSSLPVFCPSQGLVVAILYCFLNSEVKMTLAVVRAVVLHVLNNSQVTL